MPLRRQEEGARDTKQGTRGSISTGQEEKGGRAEHEKEALLWLCGKEGRGEVGSRPPGNDLSKLWAVAALSDLAPGLK